MLHFTFQSLMPVARETACGPKAGPDSKPKQGKREFPNTRRGRVSPSPAAGLLYFKRTKFALPLRLEKTCRYVSKRQRTRSERLKRHI